MSKKRAVIYCRVSTKEQVEEGNSLVTQEKVCREYAHKHGYEIAHVFVEQGESAKTANRIELQKLITFCKERKNEVSAVIAYKIDRISRNMDDYSHIRLVLKSLGVEIKSTSEVFTNDPAGRFMENIIANVAQFDNDVRTERSVNGMKEAMREGRYVWKAPLGYNNVRIQGKSTIAPNDKAYLITEAFLRVARNTIPSEYIRKEMGEKGLVMPHGKPMSKTQFFRMLRNKVYVGWIIKFGECHKGLYEPIVPQEVFDQVQLVLQYRRPRQYTYQVKNPQFPLRGLYKHPEGSKLTGCWSKGRNQKYAYYLYKKPSMVFPKTKLEDDFINLLNNYSLEESDFNLLKVQAKHHLVSSNEDNLKKGKQLKKYVEDLKLKQSNLISKNLNGVINDTILKEQLQLIDQEILTANSTLIKLPDTLIFYDELIEKLKHYLVNPGDIWQEMSFEIKLKLQWFYFPKGIVFDGVQSQTTEICKLFKVKSPFLSALVHNVPLLHQNSNKQHLHTSSDICQIDEEWQRIGEEIIELTEIVQSNPP